MIRFRIPYHWTKKAVLSGSLGGLYKTFELSWLFQKAAMWFTCSNTAKKSQPFSNIEPAKPARTNPKNTYMPTTWKQAKHKQPNGRTNGNCPIPVLIQVPIPVPILALSEPLSEPRPYPIQPNPTMPKPFQTEQAIHWNGNEKRQRWRYLRHVNACEDRQWNI